MNQPLALSVINSMPLAHTRDTSRTIVLIGFQRHSNLGIGYLAGNLQRWGYRVDVFDFEADREQILRAAQAVDPVLIGFSLIFQSYITWFGSLISYLREHGVICHFTMGGHFPSLSYERALELVPELDSVVRFEGEETLLELVDFPSIGRDWRGITGLAYRKDESTIATPMRHLVIVIVCLLFTPTRNISSTS